jgi:peptidoglycan/LPS O-acetylase OafA/YrhL
MGANHRAQQSQIVGLDLLRFAAAILVMFHHLGYWVFIEPASFIGTAHGAMGLSLPPADLFPLAPYGWLGVPIFFVISGFVIAYTANGSSVAHFVKSRVVRLLPAAWICASITVSLVLFDRLYPPMVIADAYLRSLIISPFGPWIDGAYWTLPIEIAFYATILLLLSANAMRKAEAIYIAIGIVSATVWFAVFVAQHYPAALHVLPAGLSTYLTQALRNVLQTRLAELSLLAHGCFFATGVLLWAASKRGFTPWRILALAIINVGAIASIITQTKMSPTISLPSGPAIAIYVGAIAFVILSVKFNQLIPANRTVREIGLMTYPLYLVHNVVGCFLIGHVFLPHMPLEASAITAAIVCLILVAIVIRPLERKLQTQFRKSFAAISDLGWDGKFIARMSRPTATID